MSVTEENVLQPQETERAKRVTIICWSGDLDRVYPALILATTAAASGMEVDIFFTFWGLFVLKRNDKFITGKDWRTKMLSMMNRGGTHFLKLSKLHMGGMGTAMMRAIFKDNEIASLDELLETAKELGVRMHPCQMTMDAMGLAGEDMVGGLMPVCGAAAAIEMAAAADINWFI